MLSKEERFCDMCGKSIFRYPSQFKKYNFCSRKCLANFTSSETNPDRYKELKDYTNISKNMSRINAILNPTRMTPEVRRRVRLGRLGQRKTRCYTKTYGRHTHRVVAEKMLGRALRPGEVVHHIDENKLNNRPENLMVFSSQAEHAAWHAKHNRKAGDAE